MTETLARLEAGLAGRYLLGRELGAGGMATVYLADDLRHERRVAVKVLRPELGAVLGADRFLHEIRITANLQHPHILPLFDSGAADELLWYVMPHVEGESLRDLLAREGRLPVEMAIGLAGQVASALDYAHRHGIIHRDIKPGNILLVDDQAVVADFGIALGWREVGVSPRTGTGLSLGTPQYMSPEQAGGGRPVDARTDVYALGCVLFEMLTGRPPFTGLTTQAVIAQVLTEDPPLLSRFRPESPAVLDAIVARALARDPARRYQTAGEFAGALRSLSGASDVFPTAAVERRTRRRAVGALLAVLILILGWLVFRPRPPAIPGVGQTTRLTFDPGVELDPALSPDGRMVAYAGGPVGHTSIFVRQPGEGIPIALTEGLGGNQRLPQWSPDGLRLAFLVSEEGATSVYTVPALGGQPRRLVELKPRSETQGFRWSRDGTLLAYAVDSLIYLQPIDGGAARILANVPDAHSFSWSPDGSHLAYTTGNPSFVLGTAALGNVAPAAIEVVDVRTGSRVAISDNAALNGSPVWSPEGRGLYFVSNRGGARDIWYQPLDDGYRARGEPVRLTTGLQAHTIAIAADGSRLLYSTLLLRANVWRAPIPAGGRVATPEDAIQLTTGSQAIEGIGVSADGRWLAFDSDLSGNQEIYRMPLGGGPAQRLTDHSADDFMPAWSPDGKRLAFYSFRSGNRDIFVMDADGGAVEQVTSDRSHEGVPDWSPDGRSLVFHSTRTGRSELWRSDQAPDGQGWSPARQLTRDGGANPRWSPDGKEIAFRSGFSVAVIPVEGGTPRTVVPHADPEKVPAPHWMAWSRDGQTLFFKTLAPQGRSSILRVPAAGGPPRSVLVFPDPARQSPRTEFAVDERFLYFTLGTHEADIWALELKRE